MFIASLLGNEVFREKGVQEIIAERLDLLCSTTVSNKDMENRKMLVAQDSGPL